MNKISMPKQTPSNSQENTDRSQSIINQIDGQNPSEAGASKMPNMKSKQSKSTNIHPAVLTIGAMLIVLAGSASGFGLSQLTASAQVDTIEQGTGQVVDGSIEVGTLLGNPDKEGDSATGVLQEGGLNGEGSHHILRPGGESQTVYLTSSVVDLDQLIGHEVTVWGDTFAAQSAGWLMDVVTVEVKQLNAPLPFETETE